MGTHECRIEYDLNLRSNRLFVGSGVGTATVDRTFLRNARGRPFVPASQIKGLVRQEAERILSLHGISVPQPHGLVGALDGNAFGIIGRIFGIPGGRDMTVRFSNAALAERNIPDQIWPTEVRRMVHRNRVTRRPVAHHLFDTEYAIVGVEQSELTLRGNVMLWTEGPDQEAIPAELTLLCAAMRLVRHVGGDNTTGAGLVTLALQTIQIDDENVRIEDVLSPIATENWPDLLAQ